LLFGVAYLIRAKYSYSTHQQKGNNLLNTKLSSVFKVTKEYRYPSLIVFVLGAMLGILSYTLHAFINPFLIQQGFKVEMVYQFSIYELIATMVTALVAGIYMDKNTFPLFTVVKANIFWNSMLILPFYILLLQGGYFTLIGYIALGGLLGVYACTCGVLMYRVFSPEVRCRGVLFNYAMGCAIFGGLTPLTLSALGHINVFLPGIALFICGMVILLIFKRSIKHVNLY
jgi:hypothetical protein